MIYFILGLVVAIVGLVIFCFQLMQIQEGEDDEFKAILIKKAYVRIMAAIFLIFFFFYHIVEQLLKT